MQHTGLDHMKQLRIVARLCAVGGWVLHLDPLRFEASPEWRRLHGCAPDAHPSALSVFRLIDPGDRTELEERLRLCAREQTSFEMVIGTRTFDGRHLSMRMIAEADADDAGVVHCIQGACQDVTALVKHEHELVQHRSRLEELVEQRTSDLRSFSYALAHDLRAPISAMGGFSQVLQEKLPPEVAPRVHHYVERIVSNANRAEALIEGILELISTVQAPLDRHDVDLTLLAWRAIEHLRAREPGRAVEVTVAAGLRASADARLLGAVLDNLIGNAWKFSRERAPARIEVGERADAFFVRDNGIGFDPAEAKRLFEPLHRLAGSNGYAGTGVGLAVASRIVARHGGRMWADAAPDGGATFWFTLPDT